MVRYRADTRCKVVWTQDLHKKFVQAVEKLGVDNAVPKKIVDMMRVTGLTRDHVASHLQKYRMLAKKISDAYYQAQTFSNSSLTLNHEQNSRPSYNGMHEINPLILDTSSSYFHVLESSNFSTTVSSDQLANSGSLPNEDYSSPVMANNLDEQGNFYENANDMGVVSLENSSNSGFMQNLDGFIYDYGGYSTNIHPYNNIEIGSSGDVHLNKELPMSWDNAKPASIVNFNTSSFVESSIGFESNYFAQNEFVEMGSSSSVHLNNELAMSSTNEKPIGIGNSSNSSFVESSVGFESNYFAQYESVEMGSSSSVHLNNELAMSSINEKPMSIGNSSNSSFLESSIGFESNYFGQNEFVEMGSFYGSNSNGNLENGIGEDDLMLDEDTKTFLLSYADGHGEYRSTSNNLSVTAQPPNQDVNGQNCLDILSFDSSLLTEQHSNEETITKGNQQTLDAYIPAIDPTFDMPIWSPEIVGDHMTYEYLFSGPFLGDQRINQD